MAENYALASHTHILQSSRPPGGFFRFWFFTRGSHLRMRVRGVRRHGVAESEAGHIRPIWQVESYALPIHSRSVNIPQSLELLSLELSFLFADSARGGNLFRSLPFRSDLRIRPGEDLLRSFYGFVRFNGQAQPDGLIGESLKSEFEPAPFPS